MKRHIVKKDHSDHKVIVLKKEIEDLKTGWQRTQADFDNFCKRTDEERSEILEYQKADFASKITPVLDNFSRAFEHIKKEDETPIIDGMRQIKKQIEDILASEGLKQIPASKGTQFNPELHEAISCEINDLSQDQIIAEVESGWMFQNKVLKPAKVRVSKGK